MMAKSISASAKRKGRPVTTGTGTTIGVRMLDAPLAALDFWIDKQKEPDLSRPEAIRRLVELGLTVKTSGQPIGKPGRRLRAQELATKAIEKIIDPAAPPEERALRRRRLTKGPTEFREARVDQPKVKTK
ncbi:hypothetical protein SAMN05444171_1488 [Bradyrhizobium lablabi]|jgi:hypothetical protein|uniref:Uncharacterized protein n=3 Tax=Nitrobacteraceae TaxID=41294 RepID=A0ABY0Q546_9BRAD|nr:hypothetical protein SAMN05444163_5671 [Bradyrhizobium ottawaense]SEC46950.1 hypothetical protein SAMN05444171_1488 [Bradyrhizobium lablabi]SHK68470.1 hypothetical protein SAMN05444321_0318 [Bradyrhizobium lablabi]